VPWRFLSGHSARGASWEPSRWSVFAPYVDPCCHRVRGRGDRVRVVKERDGRVVRRVRLVDDAGEPVGPVCRFLGHLGDREFSPNTLSAYGTLCRRRHNMPYDRCVVAGRPIACRSFKYTATGSTTLPAGSSSRYGSHTSPVSGSEPTRGTTSDPRSLPCPSLSIMRRDHSHLNPELSPELHRLPQ
jgi:hypothetical protein